MDTYRLLLAIYFFIQVFNHLGEINMKRFLLAFCLVLLSATALAQELPQVSWHDVESYDIVETQLVQEFVHPEASFVKVHFKKFNLPAGVTVVVRNDAGTEQYKYSKFSKDQFTVHEGDDGVKSFASMSITGDKAIVELHGDTAAINGALHSLVTDYRIVGKPWKEINDLYTEFQYSGPESTCGELNREYIECLRDDFPNVYDRRRPVAKIFNGGGSMCTAWRVGPGNRMFTNHHCNDTQADIAASESWFNYEYSTCGGTTTKVPVKVAGDQALASDYTLDYMLFTVKNFESLEPFGWQGLHPFATDEGDRIYRIGHGSGNPKQGVVRDDYSPTGLCRVDDPNHYGRAAGSDIGYFCDSIGGSSGSPVLLYATHNAVALHHYGGCLNSGAKIELIWPQVSEHFDNVVPNNDLGIGGNYEVPVAEFTVSCTDLVCNFDGTASTDPDGTIEKWIWNFGDGAGHVTGSATMEHTYAATGIYTASLSAVDNDGLSGFSDETFAANAPGENNPPIAKIKGIPLGDYLVKFADESIDYDGEIVRWKLWQNLSLETTLIYDSVWSDVSIEDFVHEHPVGGYFRFLLQIWDDTGNRDYLWFGVTVEGPIMNTAPNCDAVVTKHTDKWGTYIYNDTSTDPDGDDLIRFTYYLGDPSAGGAYIATEEPAVDLELAVTEPGEQRIRGQCFDKWGSYRWWTKPSVTVGPPPASDPPVADFTYVVEYNKVTFTDASTDDIGIDSWRWVFNDGNESTEQNPVHTYDIDAPAEYYVTLYVTDTHGQVNSKNQFISVTPAPVAPTAGFTYTKDLLEVTFTDTSTDNIAVVAWNWNFGDGNTSTIENPVHTYAAPGSYTVTLTVKDTDDLTDTETKTVIVSDVDIKLSYSTSKGPKGTWNIKFDWTGANTDTVVLKDTTVGGSWTLDNDGTETVVRKKKDKEHWWEVCDTFGNCSNRIYVNF